MANFAVKLYCPGWQYCRPLHARRWPACASRQALRRKVGGLGVGEPLARRAAALAGAGGGVDGDL